MSASAQRTEALCREIERALPDRPFTIELWDGSRVPLDAARPDADGSLPARDRSRSARPRRARARSRLRLRRHRRRRPGRGDRAARPLARAAAQPPAASATRSGGAAGRRASIAGLQPPPPSCARRGGGRHTKRRDAEAVRHHYDVSNEFFALFLDETMTYSCALFEPGTETLEDAQRAKLELICRKLELEPGQRMLDIGCGWGSLAIHAAREHGASVSGVTLSEPQAELAKERGARGRGRRPGRVQGRWTTATWARNASTRSPASAWSSTSARRRSTSTRAGSPRVLEPGGRGPQPRHRRGPGPGARRPHRRRVLEPLRVPRRRAAQPVADAARLRAGRLRDAQRREPAHRLRRDAAPLDDPLRGAPRRGRAPGGPERVRVWRLYLRAARNWFETAQNAVYQLLCSRPLTEGRQRRAHRGPPRAGAPAGAAGARPGLMPLLSKPVHIGCSGWNYRELARGHLPGGLPARR